MESLEFVVAQISWYLWVVLPHEFTSSKKTNLKRVIFATETENLSRIQEITSLRISKTPQIHENLPPGI